MARPDEGLAALAALSKVVAELQTRVEKLELSATRPTLRADDKAGPAPDCPVRPAPPNIQSLGP